jgi:hypothetical protein
MTVQLCYKAALIWNNIGEVRGEVNQLDMILWYFSDKNIIFFVIEELDSKNPAPRKKIYSLNDELTSIRYKDGILRAITMMERQKIPYSRGQKEYSATQIFKFVCDNGLMTDFDRSRGTLSK